MEAAFGLYDRVMGKFFADALAQQLTQIKKHSSNKQIESYQKFLDGKEAAISIDNLSEYVYAPMFGYADRFEYYRDATLVD